MRRLFPCLLALAWAAPLAGSTAVLTPVADTTIFEENGDQSDGQGPGMYSGRNTLTALRRGFLKFDVAGSLPGGATIVAARLDMVVTNTKGNPVDVSLFRVTKAWGEGTSNSGLPGGSGAPATAGDTTWTMRVYPGVAWTTPGGDTAGAPSATAAIGTSLGTFSFGPTASITSDVQNWLDAPATNFGWQVRADELQAAPSARRWGTRESANPAEQPILIISYTTPGGGPSGERPPNDVPALPVHALAALGAALALVGALRLRR